MMNSAAQRNAIIQRQQQIQRQQDRQRELSRIAQREAARRAEQEAAARRAQQEAARRAQEAARRAQEATRRAQEVARRAQEVARRAQETARRAQQQQIAKQQRLNQQKNITAHSQEVTTRNKQQNLKALEKRQHEKRVADGRAMKTRVHQVTSTRLYSINKKNTQQKPTARNVVVKRNQSAAVKVNKPTFKLPKGLTYKEKAKQYIQHIKMKHASSKSGLKASDKGVVQQKSSIPTGAHLRAAQHKPASKQAQGTQPNPSKQPRQVMSNPDSKIKAQDFIKSLKKAQAAKAQAKEAKKAKFKKFINSIKAKEKTEQLKKQAHVNKRATSKRIKNKISTTGKVTPASKPDSIAKSPKQKATTSPRVATRSVAKQGADDMLMMFNKNKKMGTKKGGLAKQTFDSKKVIGQGGGGGSSGSDDESSGSEDKEDFKLADWSFEQYVSKNSNAQDALKKKLRILAEAQQEYSRKETLADGRVRYYEKERPAKQMGPTRGASMVTEHNPKTGQVRTWNECYDHDGKVNRIRPKTLDGQQLNAQHYPPTKNELIKMKK